MKIEELVKINLIAEQVRHDMMEEGMPHALLQRVDAFMQAVDELARRKNNV